MKKMIFALSIMALLASAHAAVVVDDFNRANTAFSTDLSTSIGPDWINGAVAYDARIVDNKVDIGSGMSGGSPMLLINTSVKTGNPGGFRMSGIVAQDNNALAPGGLVWNYQDQDNLYFGRYNPDDSIQIARRVNGTTSYFKLENVAGYFSTPAATQVMRWDITWSAPYVFNISLTELTENKTYRFTATDGEHRFDKGYGGFYVQAGNHFLDDYNAVAIPEPATLSLLALGAMAVLWSRRRRG